MNWSSFGQWFTIWIAASFIAGPPIGRYLRHRRTRREFQALVGKPYIDLDLEAEARRDRLKATLGVAYAEVERQRMSKEAAIPITQSQWQDRAREAESMGFEQEIDSKRAS